MVYLLCPALLLLMSGCESEVFLSGQPEEGNSSDGKVRVEIFARANTYPLPLTKGLEDENTVGMAPWVLVFKGNDAPVHADHIGRHAHAALFVGRQRVQQVLRRSEIIRQ